MPKMAFYKVMQIPWCHGSVGVDFGSALQNYPEINKAEGTQVVSLPLGVCWAGPGQCIQVQETLTKVCTVQHSVVWKTSNKQR